MVSLIRTFVLDESAAALPEYALVLSVLSIASIAALTAIGVAANSTLTSAYTNFTALRETPPQ